MNIIIIDLPGAVAGPGGVADNRAGTEPGTAADHNSLAEPGTAADHNSLAEPGAVAEHWLQPPEPLGAHGG